MNNKFRVLVTGANGFLGSALTRHLAEKFSLVLAVRTEAASIPGVQGEVVAVGDINAATDWSQALAGVDTVVHCAARAHVMSDDSGDLLEEHRQVNVIGALHLAQRAAQAGVRRFVFISSIKVNGESTTGRLAYTEQSAAPEDAYGQSKHEAEQVLTRACAAAGMELVIVRPPLLYGPGVKANFLRLCKLAAKPFPLPFGGVNNRRSMLYVSNLCDFIETCITHPAAANQTFVIADGEDVSLRQLLGLIRSAMGRRPNLLPVPSGLFRLAGRVTGKQPVVDRLLGDLQVDISKARELLEWQAPFTLKQGITDTVASLVDEPAAATPGPGTFMWLRLFDVVFSACGLLFGFPVMLIIYVLGLFDTGSPLFLQERVGRNQIPFTLVKFRTMKRDTASVASHLASSASITRMGGFLRKTKLDELPQLWNVLKGEMSLVGPRPNLYNQEELIAEREALGVYDVRPGITGLAQVNEIDMSTPQLLAETDARMIRELSLGNYFKFIVQTVTGKGAGDRVRDRI